jgi:hypothetical protein
VPLKNSLSFEGIRTEMSLLGVAGTHTSTPSDRIQDAAGSEAPARLDLNQPAQTQLEVRRASRLKADAELSPKQYRLEFGPELRKGLLPQYKMQLKQGEM